MKRLYILFATLILLLTGCSDNSSIIEVPYSLYFNTNNPVVTITVKNYGTMKLQLFPEVAKITVDNFIYYIEEESYSNSTFHRIINNFMVQGGIVEKTNSPIKGEFSSNGVTNNLKHYRGVISMARTSVMNSATSQFFIVHKTSSHLDGNYASFGGLISGFEVLDQLAIVSTDRSDAPIENIIIESVTIDLRGYVTN